MISRNHCDERLKPLRYFYQTIVMNRKIIAMVFGQGENDPLKGGWKQCFRQDTCCRKHINVI